MFHKGLALPIRVYWEDTDASGIVYHANYIRYMERARSELMRSIDYNQEELRRSGFGFVIAHIDIAYKRPARLEDQLRVETTLVDLKNASMIFKQSIYRDDELITDATVRLGFIDLASGRPTAIPEAMREKFLPYLEKAGDI